MMKILPLVTVLIASGASAQEIPQSTEAPVLIGTFHGVERFEDPGHDVPGFHLERRYRTGLLIGGSFMFAEGYLFGASMLGVIVLISGVAQLAGVALMVVGLSMPSVWLERDQAARVSLAFSPTGVQLRGTY